MHLVDSQFWTLNPQVLGSNPRGRTNHLRERGGSAGKRTKSRPGAADGTAGKRTGEGPDRDREKAGRTATHEAARKRRETRARRPEPRDEKRGASRGRGKKTGRKRRQVAMRRQDGVAEHLVQTLRGVALEYHHT